MIRFAVAVLSVTIIFVASGCGGNSEPPKASVPITQTEKAPAKGAKRGSIEASMDDPAAKK